MKFDSKCLRNLAGTIKLLARIFLHKTHNASLESVLSKDLI